MEEAPDVVDNVSTSMGTVTRSGSMRDKVVWRKSRAMSPADEELFLMLPPDRDVASEEALELLREEDIVNRAGTETKGRRHKRLMPHRIQKNVKTSKIPGGVIDRLKNLQSMTTSSPFLGFVPAVAHAHDISSLCCCS